MNNIKPISFGNKQQASSNKQVAEAKSTKTDIIENDLKKIVQKTTTPKVRQVALGVASFMAVMFATRRLAVTPIRAILFKASPKTSNAVNDFVQKARPFLAETGNNLSQETKKIINGENFSKLAKNLTRSENRANKLISRAYTTAGSLGDKLKTFTKYLLDNPNKVIDYTIASSVALLSGVGIIKIDNLTSQKKLENIFGENKEAGKE